MTEASTKYFILQENNSNQSFYSWTLLYNAVNICCLIYCLYFLILHSRIQGNSHGVFRGHCFGPLLGALHHPRFFYKPVSVHGPAMNLSRIELSMLKHTSMVRTIIMFNAARGMFLFGLKYAILEGRPSANKFQCFVRRAQTSHTNHLLWQWV